MADMVEDPLPIDVPTPAAADIVEVVAEERELRQAQILHSIEIPLPEDADEYEARQLARAQELHPDKEIKYVEYAGRKMLTFRPTQGQIAAMARLGRSTRMDDVTRVSNMLDMLEAFLVTDGDRDWLSGEMLYGDMDMGTGEEDGAEAKPTALGLYRAVAVSWMPEGENRAERRELKKARRVTE